MRIEKITINNFRQFKSEELEFIAGPSNDLHVFIGENGTGKTNLLNAINWCLYGDEPHLSTESRKLPILNLKTIQESEVGDKKIVSVKITVELNDQDYIVFFRKTSFQIGEANKVNSHGEEFEVQISDNQGNTKIITGDECENYVRRFVPRKIREFFFFDGEQLDKYLKEDNVNIRRAVFDISQLDLLEGEIEKKLARIIRDLEKEAGNLNPSIDTTRKEKQDKEEKLKEIEERINNLLENSAIAKAEIQDLDEKIKGLPDIEKLEERLKLLKKHIKNKKIDLNKLSDKRRILLLTRGKSVFLNSAIKETLSLIKNKEEEGEIPPTIDSDLLHAILDKDNCSICGRDLAVTSRKHVSKLIEKIGVSSKVSNNLSRIDTSLQQLVINSSTLDEDLKEIADSIKSIDADIKENEEEIRNIEHEMIGYDDTDKIKNWIEDRKKYSKIYADDQKNLGIQEHLKKELIKKIEVLTIKLNKEMKKEGKASIIRKKIDFCTKALTVVKDSRECIMHETRKDLERNTEDYFLNMAWKTESFRNVKIMDDYTISLIHKMGYDCLGSLSAGERELLALAFTLGLHQVSGFDSPILIDTPVARISGKHRGNFGEILTEVSSEKQVILLFTPAEYSAEISINLDKSATSRNELKLSADETVTKSERY